MSASDFHIPAKAFILAGGLGTRLRAVIDDLPKPMAPIQGTPFLEFCIGHLRSFGVSEAVLLTGYRGEAVERHFGDGSRFGMRIVYSREPAPLGTAGALKHAASHISNESFFLLNGDSFFPCDLAVLAAAHRDFGACATVALKLAPDASRYGTVEIDRDYRVTAFKEKCPGQASANYINAGVYVAGPGLADAIEPGKNRSLERDILPSCQNLFGLPMSAPFIDIGVPEDYLAGCRRIPAMARRSLHKACFLTRDLCLSATPPHGQAPEEVRLRDGIAELCRAALDNHYRIIIIENSPDAGEPAKQTSPPGPRIVECFRESGIEVAGYYDRQAEDEANPKPSTPSPYREPNPGKYLAAAERWDIDLAKSFSLGTRDDDRILLPYFSSFVMKSGHAKREGNFSTLKEFTDSFFRTA